MRIKEWYEKEKKEKYYETLIKKIKAADTECVIFPKNNIFELYELDMEMKDVKVIMVFDEPYRIPNAACGRGLSSIYAMTNELYRFYTAIEESKKIKVERSIDLSYLEKQGVLFVNASVISQMGRKNSFDKATFQKLSTKLINELLKDGEKILVLCMSRENSKYRAGIVVPENKKNVIIKHHSPSITSFYYNDIIKQIDKNLDILKKKPIKWSKEDINE